MKKKSKVYVTFTPIPPKKPETFKGNADNWNKIGQDRQQQILTNWK